MLAGDEGGGSGLPDLGFELIRELEAGSHLRRDAAALSEWWQAWQAAEAVPSLEAGRAPRL